MGFNPGLLDQLAGWARDFDIRPDAAILDIGTSELFCADDPESLNRFLAHFGAEPYTAAELARVANRAFAAELFQRAGFVYQAVDITPYPHTLRVDLNSGSLPFRHRSRYSLVLNSGTTEHVLNQHNAFRLIHDACKVGGLMYHGVPMTGDFSHGLINYNPKFFTRLQEANGYEILARWIWASEKAQPYEEIEKATFNRPFAAQDAWTNFLLRKRHKSRFLAPSDCVGWPPPQ
jgi:hypothetical protein